MMDIGNNERDHPDSSPVPTFSPQQVWNYNVLIMDTIVY